MRSMFIVMMVFLGFSVGGRAALAQPTILGVGMDILGRHSPETVELPDGRTLQRIRASGISLADDPTSPAHLPSQDCFGTVLLARDGSREAGRGYCEHRDADGDLWWNSWTNGVDEDTWSVLGGTGKFAGMKGGGTFAFVLELPDGRSTIRWEALENPIDPTVAAAQPTRTGGGTITFGPNEPEMIALANGRSLLRLRQSGILLDDDPDSPFHLATQDCQASMVVAADGSTEITRGHCDSVDADGDIWWISFLNTSDGQTYETPGGTGKFAGLEGRGTTAAQVQLPDGRSTVRWDGRWQIP